MRRLRVPGSAQHKQLADQESEHGAVAVIVAVTMVAVLGFAALAIDVGAMYAEKAQLQNGADSSALAIAAECAAGACGDYDATGDLLADGNANDGSSGIASITFPNAYTVRVETNARDAGTGANTFSLFFAQVLGFETADIGAVAEASWGAPAATLPWTVSQCVFEQFLSASQLSELNSTGSFTGDPIPTHILLRYDQNTPDYPGCVERNGYQPGGFGWLEIESGCSADVSTDGTYEGQPGNHFPNAAECDAILAGILDQPAFIPLFDSATDGGNNTVYTLTGFAAFEVTGYRFGGNLDINDPDAPPCTGNCRGLQGYFTRYISIDEGLPVSGTPNYGASVVGLTK
jgi:hypothetical protein